MQKPPDPIKTATAAAQELGKRARQHKEPRQPPTYIKPQYHPAWIAGWDQANAITTSKYFAPTP